MFWLWLRVFKRRDEVVVSRERHCVVLPDVGEIEICIEVNCIGASCPRPQVLTMKAFHRLSPGETMELISDNASSVESVVAMALVLNAHHLATLREATVWRVYLRKESGVMPSCETG